MSDTLRIAAIPLDISWANPEANLQNASRAVQALPVGTDIAVLPELFTTGFIHDEALRNVLAETNGGQTVAALCELARRTGVALAGSFMARTVSKIYNRGFFIEPSGDCSFYDKRHLFCVSAEAQVFAPGQALPPVVRFRGWNISMIVCYDLRFPAWCRNRSLAYDLLLVPANWAAARGYAWKQLLIARAIENQAVVVGANRSGHDDYGDYSDLTFIFDGTGHPVGSRPEGLYPGTVLTEVSLEELQKARRRLPVSKDADDFRLLRP